MLSRNSLLSQRVRSSHTISVLTCMAPTPPARTFSSPFLFIPHPPPLAFALLTLCPLFSLACTQAYLRLFSTKTKILYTYTDEAPMYATHSLLPIIQSFTKRVGVEVEKVDLSFTARVLALFPERLTPQQRVVDSLAELGKVVKTPTANVIKLPNVSASVPQLVSGCGIFLSFDPTPLLSTALPPPRACLPSPLTFLPPPPPPSLPSLP